MSEFGIFGTNEFLRRLEKLDAPDQAYLREKLDSYVYPELRRQPFFGNNIKKLRGYSPDTWRYRIRSFRFLYTVETEEKIVYILTIEDRKDAYKRFCT